GRNRPIAVLAPSARRAHGSRVKRPSSTRRRAHEERSARRVVIVGFDDCQALDVIGPLEVFTAAREAQARAGARDPGYAPIVVSAGPAGAGAGSSRTIRTSSGLAIAAETTLAKAAAGPIDTLVIAGGQ